MHIYYIIRVESTMRQYVLKVSQSTIIMIMMNIIHRPKTIMIVNCELKCFIVIQTL